MSRRPSPEGRPALLRLAQALALRGLAGAEGAAPQARCGSNWSAANNVCGPECRVDPDDCAVGTCWGGLTLPCNSSFTSRCGPSFDSAASGCNLVCDGHFAPDGCPHAGQTCHGDADCGQGGQCHHGLPTWPCTITSATTRCGVNISDATSRCGKVCVNRGNCEVECYGELEGIVCGPTTTPAPVLPSHTTAWLLESAASLLAAGAALTLAVFFWKRQAASVTRAKRLQASAEGLDTQVAIVRQGSSKDRWCERARAHFLAATADGMRLRASKALARAAARAAGGPENWGMTVGQLAAFRDERLPTLKSYCADHALKGKDASKRKDFTHVCLCCPCPHDHGDAEFRARSSEDEALAPLPLDMHLVVALVVRPLTKEHMGIYGYATLLNLESPKKAETFISHCWKEDFEDFTRTLETLRRETVVWVCSFALPQNLDISRLLGTSLPSSPFARALLASDRVLLVVDREVEPLTRSWCCYEVYLAVTNRLRFELRPPETSTDVYRKVRTKLRGMDIRRCAASSGSDHKKIMTAIQGTEDTVNRKICEIVEDTLVFLESHIV